MEKCNYCGVEYHPMPVWMSSSKRIHVCNIVVTTKPDGQIDITLGSPCEEKAKLDGFIIRLDLTPRR